MKSILSSLSLYGHRVALVAFLASAVASVSHAEDERGKQLYANCVACHQADGSGYKLLNAPAVAGLSEKYIVAQIAKFKVGHRGGDARDATGLAMRPMASLLATDADVAAVAKYISSLPAKPVPATITDGDVEKGKAIYMSCQACHDAKGIGNDLMSAPSLVNQHDWYLVTQLRHFKEGIRGSNPQDTTGSTMRPFSMILADDQAVKDVVAYINSLSN